MKVVKLEISPLDLSWVSISLYLHFLIALAALSSEWPHLFLHLDKECMHFLLSPLVHTESHPLVCCCRSLLCFPLSWVPCYRAAPAHPTPVLQTFCSVHCPAYPSICQSHLESNHPKTELHNHLFMFVLQSLHFLTLIFCHSPRDGTSEEERRGVGHVWWTHQSCPLLAPQAMGGTYRNFFQRWVGIGTPPSPWTHEPSEVDHERLVLRVLQVTVTLPTAPDPLAENLAAHVFSPLSSSVRGPANTVHLLILDLSMLSIPAAWRRNHNAEGGFLKKILLLR